MIFQPVRQIFTALSVKIGLPDDQVTLAGTLILSVPFGLLFSHIQGRFLRLLYGSLLGLYFEYLVYGDKIIFHLYQTVFVYLLTIFFKKNCGWIVFFVSLVYLSAHHIHRQIVDYGGWRMDVTTILMMSICKYGSFSWCVRDGRAKEETLSEDQKMRRLVKVPGFFQYFAYIHFFNGSVMGPFVEFYDFNNYINKTENYRSIPSPLLECARLLFRFGFFVGCTIFLFPLFPIDDLLTPEWGQKNYFYQFVTYTITITLFRIRYYTGWTLSQLSATASGITYGGKDEKTQKQRWDHVLSALPQLELSYDIRWKIEMWNASVQVWLKRYIFYRVYSPEEIKNSVSKANTAQYLTLFMSAFWHGFYPGYYLSFFLWSIMIGLNKMVFKASQNKPEVFAKLRNTLGPVYYVGKYLIPITMLNFFGFGFQYLSFEKFLLFMINMKFDIAILTFGLFAFFTITGFGQRSSQKRDSNSGVVNPQSAKPTDDSSDKQNL